MANRRVTNARLHANFFFPGIGDLRDSLNETAGGMGTVKTLSMEWGENVLFVKINGRDFGVPHANIKTVAFAPEDTPSTTKLSTIESGGGAGKSA
jgi:hypothetical protein